MLISDTCEGKTGLEGQKKTPGKLTRCLCLILMKTIRFLTMLFIFLYLEIQSMVMKNRLLNKIVHRIVNYLSHYQNKL